MQVANTGPEETSLSPIALLIDGLRADDPDDRLLSVSKLERVAVALGPERTQRELVPFLEHLAKEEEDELVLGELASKLSALMPLLDDQGKRIAGLLELLCGSEAASVKEKAQNTFSEILETGPAVKGTLIEVVRKLALSPWIGHRQSAAVLAAKLLPDTSDILIALARDDNSTLVRRAAIPLLLKLSELYNEQLLDILKQLVENPLDSLRMHAVPLLWKLPPSGQLLEMAQKLLLDESWRVRYKLGETAEQALPHLLASDLDAVSLYIGLLLDPEAEVRAISVSRLLGVLRYLMERSNCSIEPILNELLALCSDHSTVVRLASSRSLPHIAPLLGSEGTERRLLPLAMSLLQDEDSEVRLALIQELHSLVQVIGLERLLQVALMPALETLTRDSQWRVRHAILQHLPSITQLLDAASFEEHLLPLLQRCLTDDVWAVRREAALILAKAPYGDAWLDTKLASIIEELSTQPNYQLRQMAAHLAEICHPRDAFLPILYKLTRDPVPNVRLVVARSLLNWQVELVQEALAILNSDTDPDVRAIIAESRQKEVQ